MKLTNDILRALEHQKVTAMMAIDLSAAFDTVDHDILLKVLQKQYGISGNALKWFNNYLQPRSFCVNSVPQGSCADPILYSNYASTSI